MESSKDKSTEVVAMDCNKKLSLPNVAQMMTIIENSFNIHVLSDELLFFIFAMKLLETKE